MAFNYIPQKETIFNYNQAEIDEKEMPLQQISNAKETIS